MSIGTVREAIRQAMITQSPNQDRRVTPDEAKNIMKAASKDGCVDKAEAAAIRDLAHSKKAVDTSENLAMTRRAPELKADQFYMDKPVAAQLDAFVQRHPAGCACCSQKK